MWHLDVQSFVLSILCIKYYVLLMRIDQQVHIEICRFVTYIINATASYVFLPPIVCHLHGGVV